MRCVFKVVKSNGELEWREQKDVENVMIYVNSITMEKGIESVIPYVKYDDYEKIENEKKKYKSKIYKIKYEIERLNDE